MKIIQIVSHSSPDNLTHLILGLGDDGRVYIAKVDHSNGNMMQIGKWVLFIDCEVLNESN